MRPIVKLYFGENAVVSVTIGQRTVSVRSQRRHYQVSCEVLRASAETRRAVGRAAQLTRLFAFSLCCFWKRPQSRSHSPTGAINDRGERNIRHWFPPKKTAQTLEPSQNARNERWATKCFLFILNLSEKQERKLFEKKKLVLFLLFVGNKSDKKSTTKVGIYCITELK